MDREAERCKKQLEQFRKDPQNKRCANCASLAVPYICLDFGTFVCTRCSALHRDMTHRVKSITASKFSAAEVATIRGNAYDAQMYLANWHEGLFRLPGAGNEDTERAKEFMAIKYNEKRWAHESIRPQQQVYQQQPAPQTGYPPQPMPVAQPAPQPVQPGFTGQPGPMVGVPMGMPMNIAGPMPGRPFGVQPGVQQVQQVQPAQPVQPVVEDPFADMLGPSVPAVKPSQPSPQPAAPNTFGAPTFNPGQPSGFTGYSQNAPQPVQPAAPKGFNPATYTTHQTAPSKPAGSWDMFGDMVKKAAGDVATGPAAPKPQVAAKAAPAPAGPKVDNLLDF